MGRIRRVDSTRAWREIQRLRDAGERDAADLFVYLVVGPAVSMIGSVELNVAGTAEALTLTTQRVKNALAVLVERGLVRYDPDSKLVFVPLILEADPIRGPAQLAGAHRRLEELPPSSLVEEIRASLAIPGRQSLGTSEALPGHPPTPSSFNRLPSPSPSPSPTPSPSVRHNGETPAKETDARSTAGAQITARRITDATGEGPLREADWISALQSEEDVSDALEALAALQEAGPTIRNRGAFVWSRFKSLREERAVADEG